VAKVMACYDLTKRDPFWQHRPLSLQKLTEFFPDYRRDPKGYRKRIEDACKPRTTGYAARAAPAASPTFRSADEVSPWK
jgi:hypothetical protein